MFVFYLYFYLFLLEYNCFTIKMLVSSPHWSELAIGMHMFSPSQTSLHPTPRPPSRSPRSIHLSSLGYTAVSHYLFYGWLCIYVNPNLPLHGMLLPHHAPPPPPLPHVCFCKSESLFYFCSAARFICTIFFLDSTNVHYYICFSLPGFFHSVWSTLGPATSL